MYGQEAGQRQPGPLDASPGDRPAEAGLPRHDAHLEVFELGREQDLGGQRDRFGRRNHDVPSARRSRRSLRTAASSSADAAPRSASGSPGTRRSRETRATAWRCAAAACAGEATRNRRSDGHAVRRAEIDGAFRRGEGDDLAVELVETAVRDRDPAADTGAAVPLALGGAVRRALPRRARRPAPPGGRKTPPRTASRLDPGSPEKHEARVHGALGPRQDLAVDRADQHSGTIRPKSPSRRR